VGQIKRQGFMDYIHLKKTLIAVFDHFLSCHDMAELEEMMRAFEAGKSIKITLPEAVHRDDYAQDIIQVMEAEKPKKTVSRIRHKKPKAPVRQDIKQVKICDVPVLLDVATLSREKREILKDMLNGEHQIQFHEVMINDSHGFAKARIFKKVKSASSGILPSKIVHPVQHNSSFAQEKVQSNNDFSYESFSDDERKIFEKIEKSGGDYGKEIVKNMILEIKKYRDPP